MPARKRNRSADVPVHTLLDTADPARRAGWTTCPALLTGKEIDELRRQLDGLLAVPPERQRAGDKVASGTRHLNELDDRLPLVADIINRQALLDSVRLFMSDAVPVIDQVSFRSPQPGFGGQRLHADAPPRLGPGSTDVVTAIVALVAFTDRNGATRLVPGSHDRPDLQRQAGVLDRHDDEIKLTGPAGTAFVFNGHVLHSGTMNESDTERPALQLVWRREASVRQV